MWGASGEAPGTTEEEKSEAGVKETCEQNKSEIELFKEIMSRNKQSLKKKEEEVQEYARKLSKIKSRAKLSRRNKDAASSSADTSPRSKAETTLPGNVEEAVDDISQARTPKAKSSLLQRKLAENRKIFEQRSKAMTENKRAVEEKVEAIRQQLEERDLSIGESQKDLPITPVRPVVITSQVNVSSMQLGHLQDKDNKIAELNNTILRLEATVLDLQENLKEKDSVIDSKTKAITLMSADLSKKGKTTLDTLEETKDQMRAMQEHFVLLESSLKNKNDNLLEQLQERHDRVLQLENTVKGFEEQLETQIAESGNADFCRSTLDAVVDTKDAIKSMQENFVLIESSLKSRNNVLLRELKKRDLELAEAAEKIFKMESEAGIVVHPTISELQQKLEKLEQSNRFLQDDKYELQKNIAELQNKIITNESAATNGAIVEKDNRIAELENLIEELKRSNQLLEEESKSELQKQVSELSSKNEDYLNKVNDLEKLVYNLEIEKNELAKKLSDESDESKEEPKVLKLTKELDALNKNMIKLKAQHKNKEKNLQRQLESFKMLSDTNAELVKLGNQVALLEEEKGNLQLSLVDFDELKASAGDWQERIADLDSKVSTQVNEIETHIQAIAALENQKLDLMQELHVAKQEISALEAENAESENLRVTAEMKVVELEEQLESLHKSQNGSRKPELEENELLKKIEMLTQENNELVIKLTKLEEKGTSDAGSTESFETLQETDRNELLKKIDLLTRENNDLLVKLNKLEEKGSSDTGSTESFERIPEHTDNLSKVEIFTRENNNLITKLIKLEESLGQIEDSQIEVLKSDVDMKSDEDLTNVERRIQYLTRENSDLMIELMKFKDTLARDTEQEFDATKTEKVDSSDDNVMLQKRIEALIMENNDMAIKCTKLEDRLSLLENRKSDTVRTEEEFNHLEKKIRLLTQENNDLIIQLTKLEEKVGGQPTKEASRKIARDDLRAKINILTEENSTLVIKVAKLEERNQRLKETLDKITCEKNELTAKVDQQLVTNEFTKERLELIERLEKLDQEKKLLTQERLELREEMNILVQKCTKETQIDSEVQEAVTAASLNSEIEEYRKVIAEQKELIEEMKIKLTAKEEELQLKTKQIEEYEASGRDVEALQGELKESLGVIEEWKFKCSEMEEKMQFLEAGMSIEEGLKALQADNKYLIEQSEQKEITVNELKRELDSVIVQFKSKLEEETAIVSIKEQEIAALKEVIVTKEKELHGKYEQLQNEMIKIDSLQDEINNYKVQFERKEATIASLREEIESLNAISSVDKETIFSARNEIAELHERMEQMKTVEEFAKLNQQVRDNEMIIREMQSRVDEHLNENAQLRTQIEKLTFNVEESQTKLGLKDQEIADLLKTKCYLEEQLKDVTNAKSKVDAQLLQLQNTLEDNNAYVNDLLKELNGEYKKLELLKAKHVEDTEMQNRRLEDVIEELNNKSQENVSLKVELEEKQRLLGENVTEEAKIALESKLVSLENQLLESNNRSQAQLEKMKKIAANLKKKVAQCQELEVRLAELKEKWTSEKYEKEITNNKIQEIENTLREKDNKIADLEEKLLEAQNETSSGSVTIEKLTNEVSSSKEKVASLMEQVMEMGEEIERLQREIEIKSSEVEAEMLDKQNVLAEYDRYKQRVLANDEKQQQAFDEAKENARELSVRMHVMEAEYIEQLTLIQKLKTENGLLSSKETQINEKLENVEKESEERKILLEQLQREHAEVLKKIQAQETGTLESQEIGEDGLKIYVPHQCEHCDQRQILVQALEAKLQERDAEIESLDNELANSVGNVSQMRETMQLNEIMNQSYNRNRSLEEPYNELLFQHDALAASNEEMKEKLNETIKENKELTEKINSLQALNVTLEERIDAVEKELIDDRETTVKLQNVDVLYSELIEKSGQQESELRKVQQELQAAKQRFNSTEHEMTSQINKLDFDKKQLSEECNKMIRSKENLEREIESLKEDTNMYQQRMSELVLEMETYRQENVRLKEEFSKQKGEIPFSPVNLDENKDEAAVDAPKLFDAFKAFSMPPFSDTVPQTEIAKLQNLVFDKENQCARLTEEINRLHQQLLDYRSHVHQINAQHDTELQSAQEYSGRLENELARLENVLIDKNRQIDMINMELNNVGAQLQFQFDQQASDEIRALKVELNSTKKALETLRMERDEQIKLLEEKSILIRKLESEKSIVTTRLNDLEIKKQEAERIVNHIVSVAEERVNNIYKTSKAKADFSNRTELDQIESKLTEILAELETVTNEKNELLLSETIYKNKILELERKIDESNTWPRDDLNNDDRVQELEARVSEIVRERDILQLQVNDLTRSLESLRESVGSSFQEANQRDLRMQLNDALQERDQLREQVDRLTRAISEKETELKKQLSEAIAKRESLQKRVSKLTETSLELKDSQRADSRVQEGSRSGSSKMVEEDIQRNIRSDVESGWEESESTDKLEVDEEGWGWNAEEARLDEQHDLTVAPLIPSVEIQLQTKIAELEDQIKDLQVEKDKLIEEVTVSQVRSGKLVKRLKEYKVQNDGLQKQLKIQKSSDLCSLDFAIEEELKLQIKSLEKTLIEGREEREKMINERDDLLKRVDVLTVASERFVEMKEKQDMDVEVLRIRNKELTSKVEALERQLQGILSDSSAKESYDVSSSRIAGGKGEFNRSHSQPPETWARTFVEQEQDSCKKCKEEIDDLKEEMEALATENDQLQHLLEEQKNKRLTVESELSTDSTDRADRAEELTQQNVKLQSDLDKLKEEYNLLRKQYEQSLMDANDQVTALRRNCDVLRSELAAKATEFDSKVQALLKDTEVSSSQTAELRDQLKTVLQEKADLTKKVEDLKSTEDKLSAVTLSMAEVTELLNARVQEVAELKQELQQQYVDRVQVESSLQENIRRLSQEASSRQRELDSLRRTLVEKENDMNQQSSIGTVGAIVSHAVEMEGKDNEIRTLGDKLAETEAFARKYEAELQKNVVNIEAQQREVELLKQALAESESNLKACKSELIVKERDLMVYETELRKYSQELEKYSTEVQQLRSQLNQTKSSVTELKDQSVGVYDREKEINDLKAALLERDNRVEWYDQEVRKCNFELEHLRAALQSNLQEIEKLKSDLQNEVVKLNDVNMELQGKHAELEHVRHVLAEKDAIIEDVSHRLNEKQRDVDKLNTSLSEMQKIDSTKTTDNFSMFRMVGNDDMELRNAVEKLESELTEKQSEIAHLEYILKDNTYPSIIQQLQDNINELHSDKMQLKESLSSKEAEIESMRQQISAQQQKLISRDDANLVSSEQKVVRDQDELIKLQNDLHRREQEINELQYIVAQKDSQLSLQASFEPQSDDFELQQTIQRLNNELYAKQREVEYLKLTIVELEEEIVKLKELEKLSEADRNSIERLTSEKEQIRLEAEEMLELKLREKETEIDALKQSLSNENQRLLDSLQLKDTDIENLRVQMDKLSVDYNENLHRKDDELSQTKTNLAEKESILAELSITKDAEIHNLKVQIYEKDVRIEELLALTEEEEKQLIELRQTVEANEEEMYTLKTQLANKVKEYEIIQNALKRNIGNVESQVAEGTIEGIVDTSAAGTSKESISNELDLALYMLHQRDVRCEELTLELMQLLEERDTLQLRLSNAIRVNEELRRTKSASSSPKRDSTITLTDEPIVEQPSPSKSEGPVEIAKEAIGSPIDEDKDVLAQKLSQLHNVGLTRDVRLRDERELRHTQQMSLLTHKDVLSTLPPEAAARLINANYTLSRDVQSQSSVLLNWLWGKSTPKVMHM